MLDFFKDVEIIGILSGNSTEKAKITNRPSHTLVYKVTGESMYYFNGKTFHLKSGTVLYIPEGSSYSFEKITEESTHRLVNFHSNVQSTPSPELFTISESESFSALLKQMEKSWLFEQNLAGQYERHSMFYKLLAIITRAQHPEYITTQKKNLLDPAVDYLEKHIFDSDFKVDVLPELCNMSGPTFRKIFTARFGMSPKKYIINQRIMQAKAIIESGEYKNICEVSFAVGYDDPLYFSKLFKSFYGTSPSLY